MSRNPSLHRCGNSWSTTTAIGSTQWSGVPTPEVAAFVRSVIQADQLGISLGRILRVQGADSRLRRRETALQAFLAPRPTAAQRPLARTRLRSSRLKRDRAAVEAAGGTPLHTTANTAP